MLQLGYKVLRMELIFLIFEVEMMDRFSGFANNLGPI